MAKIKAQNVHVDKAIILGDLHFFIRQSSMYFYENVHLRFFRDQLIPYMLEHDIRTIFQLGDFIDNRNSIEIKLWERIRKDIIENLFIKNDIKCITLLGNHDISLRESKDISFMRTIADMYSCIELVTTNTIIDFNSKKLLFVPWLTKTDDLPLGMISKSDFVFGHFEIKGFQMTKGHFDEIGLDPNNFSKSKIKKVYSGHYHIRDIKGNIDYVGTPFQLSWNDYNLRNGFTVFDGVNEDVFIENTVSSRYIKMKYNDENIGAEFTGPCIELRGLSEPIFMGTSTVKEYLDIIKHNSMKFFINKAITSKYQEIIYLLRQEGIDFEIINNQEISNLISIDYVSDTAHVIDVKKYILDSIKENYPELLLDADSILKEASKFELE